MTEPEFVEVSLGDDYYDGPHFTVLPSKFEVSAHDPVVRVPKDQADRWQRVFDAFEETQAEIKKIYWDAHHEAAQRVIRSRCHTTNAGVSVHVKPGCTCP